MTKKPNANTGTTLPLTNEEYLQYELLREKAMHCNTQIQLFELQLNEGRRAIVKVNTELLKLLQDFERKYGVSLQDTHTIDDAARAIVPRQGIIAARHRRAAHGPPANGTKAVGVLEAEPPTEPK